MIALFFVSCANIVPLGGGPPDKTPPEIEEISVQPFQTSFRSSSINVRFSEYVDKNKTIENIFLMPEKRMEFEWSGKSLEITFADSLESNTTYALTFGTEFTDLKGNKPEQARTLVFSTGVAVDSGRINGTVLAASPAGTYLFCYPTSAINPDTLNVSTTKAPYKTQCGSSGSFSFNALPKGSYRIVAVKDESKDGLYTHGSDQYGSAISDVVVGDSASTISVALGSVVDTESPLLVDVRPKSSTRLELLFSEPLDSASVVPSNFVIQDSLQNKKYAIQYAYTPVENNKIVTVITEKLDSGKLFRAHALPIVKDITGNTMADSIAPVFFDAVLEADTLTPLLLAPPMRDSTKNVALSPNLLYQFSTAMERDSTTLTLSFKDNVGTIIRFDKEWKSPTLLRITPKSPLLPNVWYILNCSLKQQRAFNGRVLKDTLITTRFQTIDLRSTGAIKGVVRDSTIQCANPVVLAKNNNNTYTAQTNNKGEFAFENLPEGVYQLSFFCDANNNKKYDTGNYFPFSFAEQIAPSSTSVQVKARWTVDTVVLSFSKSK